jgi:hypothetical protein
MRRATAGQVPPGRHVRRESTGVSCDVSAEVVDLVAQRREARVVGIAPRANEQIARRELRQNESPRQLAHLALQLVSTNCREAELRHHDRDAHMPQRRIESLHVEQTGADAATRTQQTLDLGGSRYPSRAREPELPLRRRRTCWAALPSDAYVPSSDGGSTLRAPTSSPCARGIHVSECGACYGGGR